MASKWRRIREKPIPRVDFISFVLGAQKSDSSHSFFIQNFLLRIFILFLKIIFFIWISGPKLTLKSRIRGIWAPKRDPMGCGPRFWGNFRRPKKYCILVLGSMIEPVAMISPNPGAPKSLSEVSKKSSQSRIKSNQRLDSLFTEAQRPGESHVDQRKVCIWCSEHERTDRYALRKPLSLYLRPKSPSKSRIKSNQKSNRR